MNSKHITIAAALIAAPLLAVVAQTASASTISLTDSWTQGTATHQTGSLPTLSTAANQSTSNLGFVSPLSNPKTQSLAQGVAVKSCSSRCRTAPERMRPISDHLHPLGWHRQRHVHRLHKLLCELRHRYR
jgi:hypothetical protein